MAERATAEDWRATADVLRCKRRHSNEAPPAEQPARARATCRRPRSVGSVTKVRRVFPSPWIQTMLPWLRAHSTYSQILPIDRLVGWQARS